MKKKRRASLVYFRYLHDRLSNSDPTVCLLVENLGLTKDNYEGTGLPVWKVMGRYPFLQLTQFLPVARPVYDAISEAGDFRRVGLITHGKREREDNCFSVPNVRIREKPRP